MSLECTNHEYGFHNTFLKLTIVTESGEILRKFEVDTGYYYGRLLLHEHKLCSALVSESFSGILSPRDDTFYLFDVRQLLRPGSGKVPHKTLFSSPHKDYPDQKYALSRTSMTRLLFEDKEDKKYVKLKTLNFWSI